MKHIPLTSLVVSTLAGAALGLSAPVAAAPAGPSSVDATINQLEAQGFDVIVSRTGAASGECTLKAVRPGQLFARSDSGAPGARDDIVTTVVSRTVYVDVSC